MRALSAQISCHCPQFYLQPFWIKIEQKANEKLVISPVKGVRMGLVPGRSFIRALIVIIGKTCTTKVYTRHCSKYFSLIHSHGFHRNLVK